MHPPRPRRAVAPPSLQAACLVRFGAPMAAVHGADMETALQVALPVLGGAETHELLADAGPPFVREGCTLSWQDGRLAGFAVAPADADLESAARELYRQLLSATRELTVYRIWNFVPEINTVVHGLENYRRFCRGRSLAFETHFGAGFQGQLPAASAVGSSAGPLAVAFLAGDEPARHFENPRQVPAFKYPPLYGPRAPSFSRATLVTRGPKRELFISGTAAIRGHATVSATDLTGQLACTHENLQLIAEAAGAGPGLGAAQAWQRKFNAYVRHDTDLLQVKNHLERHLLRGGDTVTYLQADLCRADLRVEIEAVLTSLA